MLRAPRTRSISALSATAAVAAVALALAGPASAGSHRAHHPAGAAAGPNQFQVVRLVSDQPGHAQTTDPDLVNAWGLAASPTSPIWVANNGSDSSTLYNGATMPGQPVTKIPLTVSIPGSGAPTGTVFNPTSGFGLSSEGKTGPSLFIFAGEDGDLTAWNQTGDPTSAVVVAQQDNTVWKGLTMVQEAGQSFLLASNFHTDRVDVYDQQFQRVDWPGAFVAPDVPDGFAPFGIANLGGRVYVSYAKQDADREDDVAGPGNGFIDVFNQHGRFITQLVRRGVLNSPWGMTIAPAGSGPFAGKLLVGNFGDGRIHAVDQATGQVLGTLRNPDGSPIEIDGLWGLLPGNGVSGATSDIWFSAGPDHEGHGLLGILRHQ